MFKQISVANGGELSVHDSSASEAKNYVLDNKNNIKTSSSRSRISSLSNLLAGGGEQPVSLIKTEKIGIRRLAKAYTKNLVGSWTTETVSQDTNKTFEDDIDDRVKDIKSLRIDEDYANELLLKSSPKTGVDYKVAVPQYKSIMDSNNNSNIKKDNISYQPGSMKNYKKARKPLGDNKNVSNMGVSQALSTEAVSAKVVDSSFYENKKELVLSGFPKNVGVSSILSFVSGGPLERIWPEISKIGEDKIIDRLFISFLKQEDALEFFQFAKTGLFVICGEHIQAQWLKGHISSNKREFYNDSHAEHFLHPSPLSDLILSEISIGACRCLIIKKIAGKRTKQNSRPSSSSYTRHYSAGRPHCSDFDIKEIENDFSQFGKIIEITPAISRKLCVSIHYYDVRSAILAKEEKELNSSPFHDKYSEWAIWYGKDPTDRPCIHL